MVGSFVPEECVTSSGVSVCVDVGNAYLVYGNLTVKTVAGVCTNPFIFDLELYGYGYYLC